MQEGRIWALHQSHAATISSLQTLTSSLSSRQQHEMLYEGVGNGELLEPNGSSCRGIWDPRGGGEAAYTESYTVKWPICHADGSHQAPWTGVWHHSDSEGMDRTVREKGNSLEKQGKASAQQDGRHLLHHVLGSHGDKTDPTLPTPLPLFLPLAHSPRAHSMVADRRGWGGQGLAALLRLPAPAFRLSALHICRTKATLMLHLQSDDRPFSFTSYLRILWIKINTI